MVNDLGGAGIPNIKMELYDSSLNYLNVTTLTNASGYYTLGGLLAGSYYVKTSNPMGYQDEYFLNSLTAGGAAAVSVAAFTDTPNIDFGLTHVGPAVTNITPNSGVSGTTVNITNLAGTGFYPGPR